MWEVSWRQKKQQHFDPPFPPSLAALLFSFCWAAQSGVLGAHSPLLGTGSLYSILSPTNWLQTNWTSWRTGLYHCLTSTCFLWASHLHPIQPVHSHGYTLISSTGNLFLDRRLGRRSICYNHPIIIFQNSTCGIFFTFASIHTFYKILLDNNRWKKKHKKKLLEP